jgi:hypothetical protein
MKVVERSFAASLSQTYGYEIVMGSVVQMIGLLSMNYIIKGLDLAE